MKYKDLTLPIHSSANDPWVIRHNGKYYYCWSEGCVCIREISGLDDVKDHNGTVVWSPEPGTECSCEVWAPELHYINGEWYVYVACDDGKNANHRMYVLRGTSQDPTQPFEFIGKISTPDDHWAIDGTVMQYKDQLYFIWSGWETRFDGSQYLYIAHMSDPMHIDSERVRISTPELPWEKNAMPLNEGPVALVDGDKACLVYSASGSWTDDYCLGMLTLDGGNPMNPYSWKKHPEPLLSKIDSTYGPGHCSFVKAPDESLWVIYHAVTKRDGGWAGRTCRIQKVREYSGTKLVIGETLPAGATVSVPVEE